MWFVLVLFWHQPRALSQYGWRIHLDSGKPAPCTKLFPSLIESLIFFVTVVSLSLSVLGFMASEFLPVAQPPIQVAALLVTIAVFRSILRTCSHLDSVSPAAIPEVYTEMRSDPTEGCA